MLAHILTNPFSLAGLLTGAISLALGFFIYSKDPRSELYQAVFLFMSAVALWGFAALLIGLTADPEVALLTWQFSYIFGVVWMPALFHRLVIIFCGARRPLTVFSYHIISLFFALAAITPYFFSGVRLAFSSFYYAKAGILFYAFLFYWVATVAVSYFELFKSYRQSSRPRQNQIKYFILASAIGFIGGSMAFLPTLEIDVYPYTLFALVIYPIVVVYAIIRHRLMDIEIAIKSAFLYSVIIALISWSMIIVGEINNRVVAIMPGFKPWAIPLVAGFVAFMIGKFFWDKSREAEMLKHEFITIAAHNVRAPLTRIKWATINLMETVKGKQARLLVGKIKDASDELVTLISRLLEVPKSDEGYPRPRYRLYQCDLGRIVENTIAHFANRAAEKQIAFTSDLKPVQPVLADETRISMAIEVLLENAVNYTLEKGAIQVSLETKNDRVVFSVTDSGIGIPSEDLPYIFTKFFRSKNAMAARTEGLGLGLTFAENIIRQHRGKIGVESPGENRGTYAWFSLPVTK